MAGETGQTAGGAGGNPAPATGSGGAGTAPVTGSTGQTGAAPVQGGAAAPVTGQGGGQGGGTQGSAGQQGQAAAPSFVPVHQAVQQLGYNLPSGLEGQAALQYLVAQAQQAQQLAQIQPHMQQYLSHADKFQAWMREQQAAEEAKKKSSWWKAPEWDPSWRQKVQYDPQTGEIKAAPGVDPSIVQKYLAAMDHRQGFLDKFTVDPIGAIKPGLEEIVKEIIQPLIQQHLGGYQDQQFTREFLAQHSGWLYERDAQGQMRTDPVSGGRVLSVWGQRFQQYLGEAEQLGIQGEQQRANYALRLVKADYATSQGAPATAQQQGDAAKQTFLQTAQAGVVPPTNGAQTIPGTGGSLNADAQNKNLPLAERIRQNFAAAGITADQINATLQRVA